MNIILWIGGILALLLIAAAIERHVQMKAFPECIKCGVKLTEENTYHQDDDEDICIECYAKLIAPEYYDHYHGDR